MAGVLIQGPENSVELTRAGDGWLVNGHAADSASVGRFWDAVAELDVRSLVASNPVNHARLGVSEDSTWTLTFRPTDGEPLDLLLGHSGPSFSSAYGRIPGADAVYLIEGGVRAAATRRIDDWRDKTVIVVDTAAVWTLALSHGGTDATVTRSDVGWEVDGSPADSAAVANLLSELSAFQATGFVADTVPFDGEEHRRVTALDVSGDTLAVVEIAGTGGTFMARTSGSPVLYTVPSWRVDRLVPTADDLLQTEPSADAGN
jgi:hypothetical protein